MLVDSKLSMSQHVPWQPRGQTSALSASHTGQPDSQKRGLSNCIQHCHGLLVCTECSKKHTKALEYNQTRANKLVEELEGLSL